MAGVIVPLYPGVYSAIGLLMSDVKHDYIQSRMTPLDELDADGRSTACSHASSAQAAEELHQRRFCGRRDPHRARARHALCRAGLRDRHAVPSAACRTTARRAAREHSTRSTRPCSATWRPRSRSRSSPIACAASAWCRRSRCRDSSRAGAHARRRACAKRDACASTAAISNCPVYQRERLDVGLDLDRPGRSSTSSIARR